MVARCSVLLGDTITARLALAQLAILEEFHQPSLPNNEESKKIYKGESKFKSVDFCVKL